MNDELKEKALLKAGEGKAKVVFESYGKFKAKFKGEPTVCAMSISQGVAIQTILELDGDNAMTNHFEFYSNLAEERVILKQLEEGRESYFGDYEGNVLKF